jgi:hypothetical protein
VNDKLATSVNEFNYRIVIVPISYTRPDMQNFNEHAKSDLIDLLADFTAHLTRLLQEKNRNEEYLKMKLIIKQLTTEIEARKSKRGKKQTLSGINEPY